MTLLVVGYFHFPLRFYVYFRHLCNVGLKEESRVVGFVVRRPCSFFKVVSVLRFIHAY